MPRYLLTQGSLFDPFSYEELARPIKNMAEIHRQTQDAYDTLSMETEALRNYITDNPDDSRAKEMFDNYVTSLNTLQDNLWNNGYTAQTRRDLARARSGYASDITRIQKAITDRQERSKEYWETWHQNPDQVRGTDPGLSGLDNYLNDDLYGRDYYSYSGNQFSQNVAAEAKARRAEMLRDPQILTAGKVPGYITRLIRTGFTNEEVDTAYQAVRAALFSGENGEIALESLDPMLAALDQLNDNSAVLARVLVTNLESTGALGNLDKTQMERLLDYGRIGLASAVGEPDIKDFEDPYFKQSMELSTYRKEKDIDREYAEGENPSVGSGYIRNRGYNRLVSGNAAKMSEFIGEKFTNNYRDADGNPMPISLKRLDGSVALATDAASMGLQLYDTKARRGMQTMIPGFDIALLPYDKKYSDASAQFSDDGRFRTANLRNITDDDLRAEIEAAGYTKDMVLVLEDIDGKWKFNESASYNYNVMMQDHEREMQRIRELNKIDSNRDIDDYAMSPAELQEVKKEQGLEGIADADVPVALRRMAVDELVIAPTIVSPSPMDDGLREEVARFLDDFFGGFSAQGLLGKSSQGGFYKIDDGSGYSTSQEAVTEKSQVFQIKGGAIDPSCISSVQIMPRDAGDEGVRVRIRVINADSTTTDWEVDSYALGEIIGGTLNSMSDDLNNASEPFRNPKKGFKKTDEDSESWSKSVLNTSLFRDKNNIYFPISPDETIPSEKDILRDDNLYEEYQEQLTSRIQQIINEAISVARNKARGEETNANRPKETSQQAVPTLTL